MLADWARAGVESARQVAASSSIMERVLNKGMIARAF
jgi:hypothetical protein